MVSQIGAPVTCPVIVAIKVAARNGRPVAELRNQSEAIASDRLARIPALVDDFVAGKIEYFSAAQLHVWLS